MLHLGGKGAREELFESQRTFAAHPEPLLHHDIRIHHASID
jgi:hypothetical protein